MIRILSKSSARRAFATAASSKSASASSSSSSSQSSKAKLKTAKESPHSSSSSAATSLSVKEQVRLERRGKFMSIAPSLLAHQSTKKFDYDSLSKRGLMVRNSTLESVSAVKTELDTGSSKNKIILVGPSGIGKSSTLLQTVTYFQSEGWLVIYIPSAFSFIDGKSPFQPVKESEGKFDLPLMSQNVLQWISDMNEPILKKLVVSVKDIGYEHSKDTISLFELAQVGIKDQVVAPHILQCLIKAITLKQDPAESSDGSIKNRPPMLIAIDQINALFTVSHFFDQSSRRIESDDLVLVDSFIKLFNNQELTNTVCVAAHDSSSLIAKGAFSEYLKTSTTTLPTFASLTASPTSLAYQRGNLDGSPELFQFQSRDSVNVLLPTTLSKMHVDPFANKMHLFPQNVKCLPISPFRKDEIMISMRMADTFFSEELNEFKADEVLVVTGGNPRQMNRFFQTAM